MLIVVEKRILRALAGLCAILTLLAVLPEERRNVGVSAETELPAILVIDPGHGGEDGGAVAEDGTEESELNLAVALRLREICFLAGIETVMTREEDVSIHTQGDTIRARKVSDIRNRVELVNSFTNQTFISIHQNSLPQAKSVHGAHVFYRDDAQSAGLAKFVQERLNNSINLDQAKDCRMIDPSVYLMRNISCPAVLIECGFLSNEGDRTALQTDTHQKKIALTAAAGYLSWRSSGEGEEI